MTRDEKHGTNQMNIWQRKLLAFLHDPPSKPFNIVEHRAVAEPLIRNAGFDDPNAVAWFFDKVCDHTAAAADRVVCPKSSDLKAGWDKMSVFKHPLGGGELRFEQPIDPVTAEKQVGDQQPHHADLGKLPEDQRDWAKFFLHWRLWRQRCAEKHPSLAHMPADTRIPDHTIWTHCSIVSALQSCVKVEDEKRTVEVRDFQPAFLLVQIGPVQEFIAQARSTRDLWSGSYLLSWLIAHGIKAITDEVGPDCVLFPSLRGQPLFDFLHKESLYDKLDLWNELRHAHEHILTPNLPNRFLAVVPEWQAQQVAVAVEKAMQEELQLIGDACAQWLKVEEAALARWNQQLRQFLNVTWQTWTWETDVANAVAKHPELKPAHNAAITGIPPEHLDPRNYKHESWREGDHWRSKIIPDAEGNPVIDNPGFAWAAHYAEVDKWLAARRNTRDFEMWDWEQQPNESNKDALERWLKREQARTGAVKDMLSGKEEVIGSEDWQKALANIPGHYFRDNEKLGALNLIKRVWHRAYLTDVMGLEVYRAVRFESMPEIAAGSPNPPPSAPKYLAIIALDGDSMGKWVSGENAPHWRDQLAGEAIEYFEQHEKLKALLGKPRHVSPSYHLQLSEALANFALYLAGPIVEHYDGQLIYAGGDDVVAMLPAENALKCAQALRMAFRGDPKLHTVFSGALDIGEQTGFVGLDADAEIFSRTKRFVPRGYPLIVPGKKADISAGIAIGHMHAPLQNLVEAARQAEKRAKQEYGKSAFAISLFKRSGETIQWGAKWDSHAIELAGQFAALSAGDKPPLSAKFPYALARLLRAYAIDDTFRIVPNNGFDPFDVFPAELAHCVKQQDKGDLKTFKELADAYLGDCENRRLDDFLGPFLTTTFINRGGGE
jgi:hypothetical protein